MTIIELCCDYCHQVIAYTNKRIPETSHNYLKSEKLTTAQKCAFIKHEKFFYCKSCHDKDMQKLRAEVKAERNALKL